MKSLKGLRILLVEDDLLSLEAYQTFLSMEGATVESATSVAAASNVMAYWLPDVIVSDIGLPDEDGYSLIHKVRSNPSWNKIHAIAVTGYSDTARALESGYQEVMKKPLSPQMLVNTLKQFLRDKS